MELESVKLDKNLLKELRKLCIEKHGKAHGFISAELSKAVELYLFVNDKEV